MCKNATKCVTNEAFDLVQTWFNKLTQDMEDPISDPFAVVYDKSSGKLASASNGAGKPNLCKDHEGGNKIRADSNNQTAAKPKSA